MGTVSAERYDLIIIGSGPAGLSAAAHAHAEGLRYVLLERTDHLADTVHCYQKRKFVMAEPGLVPQAGPLPFEAGSREEVLEAWQRTVEGKRLEVRFGHEVTTVEKRGGSFVVKSRRGEFQAANVVVAVGTQGNPRRLGVPGEDLPHVTSRLVDPDAHTGEDVAVVGAGDSALEVALALSARNKVSLVVRGAEIVRAKESLEREVLSREAAGQLTIFFNATVRQVEPGALVLSGPEGDLRVAAGRVIPKIGADPPRKLLESWGVRFAGPERDARPVVDAHWQSSVPGLYLVGAITGRDLIKLGINQGYEVVEHVLGREVEPADEGVLAERLPHWPGTVRERIDSLRDEIPVLGAADGEQLREILLSAQPLEFADGETILRQNDYTDSFLVITHGVVAISKESEDGRKREVAELQAGNFFGEMGLISGRRRNATAKARGKTRLLEIPRKAMLKLLHLAPGVKDFIDRTFLIRALQSYLFPEVREGVLWRLAARARLERLERDRVVFEEGSRGEAFYLVRSGMVKLSQLSGEREVVLTYLVAGNYFGEAALLTDKPRTATVTTIFPTELIVLERGVVEALFGDYPELRQTLERRFESKKVQNLVREGSPGAGEILGQLIATEAVIGTDVLVIDNHKCVRCGNCVSACEGVHDDGQARLSLTGDRFANLLLPNSCMQCENPLCMIDCPPDAIVRRPGGEIYIKDNCIGCGNCEVNCPYDNIFMVHPKPAPSLFGWLRRLFTQPEEVEREVAVKCDLCRDVWGGPACVRSCPTGAALRLEPQEPGELERLIGELVMEP